VSEGELKMPHTGPSQDESSERPSENLSFHPSAEPVCSEVAVFFNAQFSIKIIRHIKK
jgi:hypothetical protein